MRKVVHCPVITEEMVALFASQEQFNLGKKIEQTQPMLYKNCFFREQSKNK